MKAAFIGISMDFIDLQTPVNHSQTECFMLSMPNYLHHSAGDSRRLSVSIERCERPTETTGNAK